MRINHGSRLVFIVPYVFMVIHSSRLVFCGSMLVFMVPGRFYGFSWFQADFTGFHGSRSFYFYF